MLDLGGYNHSYAVELEKLRNYLAFFHKYVFPHLPGEGY